MTRGALSDPPADWFRDLAETVSVAIFVYRGNRFLYVNSATEELTGWDRETLLSMGPRDLVHPDDWGTVLAEDRPRRTGAPRTDPFSVRIIRRDGIALWTALTIRALPLGHGRQAGLGTAIDLTSEKAVESQLQRQLELKNTLAAMGRRFLAAPVAAPQAAFEYNLTQLVDLVDGDTAHTVVITPGGRLQVWGSTLGPHTLKGWSGRELRRGTAIVIERLDQIPSSEDEERQVLLEAGVGARLAMPIMAGQTVLGAVAVECRRPRRWSRDNRSAVDLAAQLMASAMRRLRAESEARAVREWLEIAQRAGRSVAWEWHLESDRMLFSANATQLFRVPEKGTPSTGAEFLELVPAEDRAAISQAIRTSLSTGEPYRAEHRTQVAGETIWLVVRGQLEWNENGRATRLIGVSADITDRKEMEEELRREKEMAQVTLASIGDAVIRTDASNRINYLNPRAEQLLGVSSSSAIGRPLAEIYRVVDRSGQPRRLEVESAGAPTIPQRRATDTLIRPDGSRAAIEDTATPLMDRTGSRIGLVVAVRDVTPLRRLERETAYLATHDPLTGLINRREFERQLEQVLEETRASDREHYLCFLDLDEFKVINDSCGHLAGDELLSQLGSVLSTAVRPTDLVARVGGDEFGALLTDTNEATAVGLVRNIIRAVTAIRFARAQQVFTIGISVGIVPISAGSGSFSDALRAADAACFVAKTHGHNQIHVSSGDDAEIQAHFEEVEWIRRINAAIEEDRLQLYAQPIQPLQGLLRPKMAEILLRMRSSTGAVIEPGRFLPAAERYRLMPRLDRWVIERAMVQLPTDDTAHVWTINLSGQSLGDPEFQAYLSERVQTAPLPADRLCFEITETAAIANLARARDLMEALSSRGCRFILDDFGSGLSSFAYLQSLPVQMLKIDGELARRVDLDPIQLEMVTAIHRIAHSMHLETIAESIESNEALEVLRTIGIDYGQGYWLGFPAPLLEAGSTPPV